MSSLIPQHCVMTREHRERCCTPVSANLRDGLLSSMNDLNVSRTVKSISGVEDLPPRESSVRSVPRVYYNYYQRTIFDSSINNNIIIAILQTLTFFRLFSDFNYVANNCVSFQRSSAPKLLETKALIGSLPRQIAFFRQLICVNRTAEIDMTNAFNVRSSTWTKTLVKISTDLRLLFVVLLLGRSYNAT